MDQFSGSNRDGIYLILRIKKISEKESAKRLKKAIPIVNEMIKRIEESKKVSRKILDL